jgi:predicted dehydrogenase
VNAPGTGGSEAERTAPQSVDASVPDYRPPEPKDPARHGIAVLGAGQIVRTAHLPAYTSRGWPVTGVWSPSGRGARAAAAEFPEVGRVYDSAGDLLADPSVAIVDLATRVEHRLPWLRACIEAGKHVLAQKPLADRADAVRPLLQLARERGVVVAVNQNARWAPVWRLATLLVRAGAIGEVVGVTHVLDKPLPPIVGTHFDDIPHMLIADYLNHWVDITRCWLGGKQLDAVRARDGRVPGQPSSARTPWAASIEIECTDGASATMRIVGDVRTGQPSCPFWIHGTQGALRGAILGGDRLSLDRGGAQIEYELSGAWFTDGFAGAMGELMCAIEDGREPYNSAEHNLATLDIVTAAVESAETKGAPVPLCGGL